jgi:hypothetical protein
MLTLQIRMINYVPVIGQSDLQFLSHFILLTTLSDSYSHYPHFVNEETEAQREESHLINSSSLFFLPFYSKKVFKGLCTALPCYQGMG